MPDIADERAVLLDLCCGAGGASKGYHDAGFRVVGVDMEDHPSYPYELIVADIRDVIQDITFLRTFDVIAASPPCQELTRARHLRDAQGGQVKEHGVNLIPVVRPALETAGRPYVIENVVDALPWMRNPIMLCGSMFGLAVQRHRYFESPMFDADPWGFATPPCRHDEFPNGRPIGVYGSWADEVPGGGHTAKTIEEARAAMGIDWMRWRSRTQEWNDLKEAIPPAYTEWIGRRLLTHLEERAA